MLAFFSCSKHEVKEEKKTADETAIEEIVVECGQDVGDYACDFAAFNHRDNEVSLSDFKGNTILLDFSTMWCYYCNIAAMAEPEIAKLFEDKGFVWVTVLVENKEFKRPSCSDLRKWVSLYNIKSPVLSGEKNLLDFTDDGIDEGYKCGGYPTFVIINKDFKIVEYIWGWNYENLKLRLEEVLNEEAV